MKKKIKRLLIVLLVVAFAIAPVVSAQFVDGSDKVWSITLDGIVPEELDEMLEDAVSVETDSDYLTDAQSGDATVIGTKNILGYKNVVPADLINSIQLITENTLKSTLLNMWPVGSIYMTTSDDDPSDLIGGEWEAWGSGKVPVGVGSGMFAGAEAEGGNMGGATKTATITWPASNAAGSINFSPGSASIQQGSAAWNTASAGVTINNPAGLVTVTNGTISRTQNFAMSVSTANLSVTSSLTRTTAPSFPGINGHALTIAQMPSHSHAALGYWTMHAGRMGDPRQVLTGEGSLLTDDTNDPSGIAGDGQEHSHGHSIAWPTYSLTTPSTNNHSSVAHTISYTQPVLALATAPTVTHGSHTAAVNWPVFSYTSPSLTYTPPSLGNHNLSLPGGSANVDVTDSTLQPYITCYMWKRIA